MWERPPLAKVILSEFILSKELSELYRVDRAQIGISVLSSKMAAYYFALYALCGGKKKIVTNFRSKETRGCTWAHGLV